MHLQSRRRLVLAVIFLLAAGLPQWGQQEPTFSTDVKVVNVLATVRDKQGRIAKDLAKDDFLLEEDGRPQAIRYFSRQTDLPLTLGLLVDTSMSQRRLLGEERQASYRFFDQVLRESKDMAFVIHFDREVELLQDLTSSRKDLEAALAQLEVPRPQWGPGARDPTRARRGRGGTSLYDAVLLASDELMRKQSGRKALILLTDGVDTGSKVPITEAIEAAQRADTLIYSIRFYDEQAYMGGYRPGPFPPPKRRRRGPPGMRAPRSNMPEGKKVLQRLSRETGGGFFDVSKKQPIDRIFEHIEEELRNQYNLGYTSDKASAAGEFRKIRLTTKEKGLIVQARDGYYAGR